MAAPSIQRVGHHIHTLRDIDPIDRETVLGLPTMSPTRALLQIAALHDADRVRTALEEGTPIVVETLGYRWHRTNAQMSIDAERSNRLLAAGYLPVQFTYQQVTRDPEYVIATLLDIFARCGVAPRPRR